MTPTPTDSDQLGRPCPNIVDDPICTTVEENLDYSEAAATVKPSVINSLQTYESSMSHSP